jgi:hypothetical protein
MLKRSCVLGNYTHQQIYHIYQRGVYRALETCDSLISADFKLEFLKTHSPFSFIYFCFSLHFSLCALPSWLLLGLTALSGTLVLPISLNTSMEPLLVSNELFQPNLSPPILAILFILGFYFISTHSKYQSLDTESAMPFKLINERQ